MSLVNVHKNEGNSGAADQTSTFTETIDRAAIDQLLSVPGCVGLRIHYALDAQQRPHALLEGVHQTGNARYRKSTIPHFSRREKQIIQLICQERSNKEIADKLKLSIRTIESYRERIFEKTGARNMAGVVVYAIKHQLYIP